MMNSINFTKIFIIGVGIFLVVSSLPPSDLEASHSFSTIEPQLVENQPSRIGEVLHNVGIAFFSDYTMEYVNFTLIIDNLPILIRVNVTGSGFDNTELRYSSSNGSNFDASINILNNNINDNITSKYDEEQFQGTYLTNESVTFFDPQFIEKSWSLEYIELNLNDLWVSNTLLGGFVLWKFYGYENTIVPEPITTTKTETTTLLEGSENTIQVNHTVTNQLNFTTTETQSQNDTTPFPFLPFIALVSIIVLLKRK